MPPCGVPFSNSRELDLRPWNLTGAAVLQVVPEPGQQSSPHPLPHESGVHGPRTCQLESLLEVEEDYNGRAVFFFL